MPLTPLILAALLAAAPQDGDEARAVGSALWRIASPGIYVSAPDNLKSESVEWSSGSAWVGASDKLRVEISSTTPDQFGSVTEKLSTRLGTTGAQDAEVSGYAAKRLTGGGNHGLVVNTGRRVWAIGAIGAESAGVIDSVFCERVEPPVWRDRHLGSTSMQCSLPYDTEPTVRSGDSMASQEAAWNGMRVGAYEPKSLNVDYEATVANHVKEMEALPDAKVTVIGRDMQWLGEMGTVYTCDYTHGGAPRRLIKLFARPGARPVWMSLDLDPARRDHLAAADRILKTIRTGWTTLENFRPQTMEPEGISLDAPTKPTLGSEEDGIRVYDMGSGWSALSFDSTAAPAWVDSEREGMLGLLKQLTASAGGKWNEGRAAFVGIGPFLGVVAEGDAEGQAGSVYASSVGTMLANKIVFFAYFTPTASFDVMQRVADSMQFKIPAPEGWVAKSVAGLSVMVPGGAKEISNELVKGWEGSANGVTIHVHEEVSEDLVPKTTEYFEILNAEKVYAPTSLGRAYGHVGQHETANGRRRDVISLNVEGRAFFAYVDWDISSPESHKTRDAFLASIKSP